MKSNVVSLALLLGTRYRFNGRDASHLAKPFVQ